MPRKIFNKIANRVSSFLDGSDSKKEYIWVGPGKDPFKE